MKRQRTKRSTQLEVKQPTPVEKVEVLPKREPTFNILTNDPSFTGWGWVVINQITSHVIASGVIKTSPADKKNRIRKGDDRIRRIGEIYRQLRRIIEEHNVEYIFSELPHGSQNAQAAMMVGATAAITAGFSNLLDIGVEWYSEGDAKRCLLGKQSATKAEIIAAISKHYDVKWTGIKWRDEAVADALAIHYVAMSESATLKLISNDRRN